MAKKSQKTLNNEAIINTILSGKATPNNNYNKKERLQHIKDSFVSETRVENDKKIMDVIQGRNIQPSNNNNAARIQHIKDSLASNNRGNTKNVPFYNSQADVKKQLADMNKNGNVDLLNRPVINAKRLEKAGWGKQEDGIATVYSSSYSNKDGTKTVLLTPILQNGTVLSPNELDKEASDILDGKADKNNILIGTFTGADSIQQAGAYGEKLHNLHASYYGNSDSQKSFKTNSLFGKLGETSFENNPQYQKEKNEYKDKTVSEFKVKYGKDLEAFNQEDYYKWATERGFKFMHAEQAGLTENPILGTKNTDEDKDEEKKLRYLVQYNNRRNELESEDLGTAKSFSAGTRDSITFYTFKRLEDWADKKDLSSAKGEYARLLNDKYKVKLTEIEDKNKEEHPVAYSVGEGAGELTKMIALKGAISKATGSVKWLASKPEWIISAINDGLTFSTLNAANTAGAGGSAKEVAKEAGIGAVGGVAGSLASSAVGAFGENLLFKTGLQNKIIPEIARNGAAATSFSLADSAATYFLHPKEERPTAGEIAQNAVVAFAFASITTALNVGKMKKSSKAALDYVNEKMINDYDNMLKSANANDPESVKKFAQNVIDYSESMEKYLDGEGFKIKNKTTTSNTVEKYLTGETNKKYSVDKDNVVLKKARFMGEDKRVRSIQEDLRTIRNRANEFLNKANSVTAEADTISASSTQTSDIQTENNVEFVPRSQRRSTVSQNNPNNENISFIPRAERRGSDLSTDIKTTGNLVAQEDVYAKNSVDNILAQMTAEAEKVENGVGIAEDSNNVTETTSNADSQKRFSPFLVARDIIKQNNSSLKASEISDKIKKMQNVLTDGAINEDSLNRAWSIASEAGVLVAETAKETNSDMYDTYKDLRDKIRNTPVSISDTDKADIGGVDSFNEFRKNNFGGMRISNNGIPIDSFYQELSEMYPNFFDAQKETHPAEQLMKIQNVLEEIKPIERNVSSEDKDALSESIAAQIYNECINNLPLKFIDDGNTVSDKDISAPKTEALTSSVAETMNNTIKSVPADTSHMQETNEMFQSEKNVLFDKEFVSRYADDFVAAIANKNGSAYQQLSTLTDNLAGELTNYTLAGQSSLSGNKNFEITANAFKSVLTDAVNKNAALHNNAYGNSDVLNAQVNDIRNGDFSVMNITEKVEQVKTESEPELPKDNQDVEVMSTPLNNEQNTENIDTTVNDNSLYTINKDTDTRDNSDIWIVKPKERLSKEDFTVLRTKMKNKGGYYSRYKGGFLFRQDPTELLKPNNDMVDTKEYTPAEQIKQSNNTVSETDSGDLTQKSEISTEKPIEKAVQSDIIENKEGADGKSQQIADFVKDKLQNGEKITSDMLFKAAGEVYDGTLSDNTFTVKDAYDAMELGVNQYILSLEGKITPERMDSIIEKLPTQTKRTEGMDKYQQFSTPPTIAYYANYAANINGNDTMLEPSAGIGGIAVFAKKDGAKVIVNELDNRRLSVLKNMPFDAFYNENAEQINNILGGEIEPTVVVMNPPFSSSSERNIKSAKIGAKHIEEALKMLVPNGRLVAITGKSMSDDAPAFRDWWRDIKSKYNVVANIGISGKNYNKYGTNFGIQMLVIDKNGATKNTQTGYVENISDLQEILGGIRDGRPTITGDLGEKPRRAVEQRGNGSLETGTGEKARGGKRTDTEIQQTEASPARKETANRSEVLSKSDNAISDTGNRAVDGKRKVAPRNTGKSELSDVLESNSDDRRTSANEQLETDVLSDTRSDIHSGAASEDENTGGTVVRSARKSNVRNRLKKKELTDSIFEQYQTQPLKLKGIKQHPAKISESAAMSAILPPTVTYKPSIPDNIVKNGVLSDVQLEAVTYAGQSHNQTLPNGETRGFFVGDGTGVGKGRTLTGIILDNYMQGRKKSIWVTLNSSLFNDMKRDVKALFGNSDLVHSFKGGKDAEKSLAFNDGILAVSYDTLSSGWDNKDSNFEKIIDWFGKDFDGVIVFDEAHKMANSGKKGTRGRIKPSQAALSGIEIQKRLPKARVVYSSATGATEVENLRYAERLGLWGEGTAFLNSEDFVSKIKAGGLAAMELIARDMKAQGVYLSRNISYDDVKYDRIIHKLTAPQRKIYNELAHSWQIVFQNMNEALKTTNQISDGKAKQRAVGGFWGSQQRFFNQILTSMQVPSVIKDMEKQLADGNSCVVQLVSTNEAADKKEFARLKEAGLDLEDFDTTPKQMLMNYIEHCFPVQQYEEYRDDDGNKRSKPVFDSKGKPVINREAARQKEELLDKLGSIKVLSSPIDLIIDHFGADMVAENTGRSRRVEEKNGKRVEVKLSGKKDADVDAFQSGKKRIIIFSKAGGTGKSYHADLSAKNQQHRVHYLLEPGWRADDAVQGFGRSHRSNQASSPTFKLVTTDLKGQMRFVSTIAKRLDQLGALTKGQRQAGGQGMFSASDNLENSFAQDVLAVFYKDLINNRVDGISDGVKIVEKLGLKDKILDEYGAIKPSAQELREVNKFLNRILCLDSDEQNTVFEGYSVRLEEATESAAQAGTLDRGLENYKADKISVNESKDIRIDQSTGAATKYYNLTAKNKVKPVQLSELPTDSKDFLGYYQNNNTGAVRAVFKSTSRTDQYGNVTANVKLYTQIQQKNGRPKCEYQPSTRLYANWKKISDTAEAEKLWSEAIDKLPEYTTENIHLIGGVVLPVWDKLPTENVRIYRVLTDEGDMLIGRVIPENLIDGTLRRMGATRTKEEIKTSDLIQRVKQGDKVHLDNGWIIKQSRVSGEQRIEIVGPSYEHTDILKNKGVFTERISYATRYFIPANTGTEKVVDGVLNISPVERVESSNVNYSKDSDSSVMWGNDKNTSIQVNTSESKELVKNLNNARKVFIEYAKEHFPPTVVNKNTGREIGISRKGLDKFLSGNISSEKLASGYVIPQLIETAEKIGEAVDNKKRDNISGYEYYYNTFSIDGQPYSAHIRIRNTRMGDKYYGHTISRDISNIEIEPLARTDNEVSSSKPVNASGSSTNNISNPKENVKNSLKNFADNKKDWKGKKDDKAAKPLHEIVSYLSDTFGVPISTGNLNYNKAQGQYKNFENSIRVKITNDLPNITHELGHLLDKKYDLKNMSNIDEALDFAERNHPTLMQLYKDKDKLNEAVAEFVREYLKNPNNAEKETPNFYKEFTAALDEQDAAALEQASKYIQDYFNSDFREKVNAATITNKEIKKAEKGNTSDRAKQLYTKIVDDFAPINDVMKYVNKTSEFEHKGSNNAYTMAINSRNADAVTSFILKVGMADSNGNMTEGKSFIDCIEEINPNDIKDFDNYLILKHSVEWLEPKDGEVKRVFADDSLQDVERIKEEISSYEEEHPEYKTASENLYEYQRNILKMWAVDTGGMSEDLFKELQEKYPNYVPFRRYIGKNKTGVKSTFANQHTPISKAKGSGASIISPLESIMQNTSRFVKFGVRNKVMGTLVNYTDNVEGFAQFMEEVPPDKIRHSIGIIPQVEKLKDIMSGLDEPDFLELSDVLDNIFGDSVTSYTPVAKAGKQIVTYMDSGKYRYFQVHDKPLYEAIANMEPRQIEGLNKLGKMLNATNVLITQFNYLFGIKNPIRDFGTALKHSKAYDNPAKFAAAYATSLWHIIRNSKEYKEYQAAGGGHMSNFSDSIDAVQKALHDVAVKDMNKARRLAYSIFRHPIEALTRLNEITETIPRLAEFEGMKKRGADNQEAAYEAADVTVNFNRSGSAGRAINKVFRFSNAQVQGVDKEARTFTTGGKNNILKYVMRYVLSAVLTSALLEFWNRLIDEDGWEELSQYQKNNFYCIAYGDGKFIKLPKAREAAIPNTLIERSIDFAFGDKDAFYQFGEYIGDTILPSWLPLTGLISGTIEGGLEEGAEEALHQAVGSTMLSGIVDNMVNEDFKGTPIVSSSLEDTPKKQQTNNKTTWLAYAIGQLTNTSPLKADHIIDSYTGILGKLNRAFGTMDSNQIDPTAGLKSTFTADSVYSTDTFNKVYERRDKQKEKFLNNSTPQNACLYEKYAITASYITKSNRIIKPLPAEEQRETRKKLIDDIKNMNMSVSGIDKSIAKSFGGNVDDSYCLTTMPKEEISYTKNGKSYSYTLTYDEYRDYVNDYMEEVEKQREKVISKSKYSNASDNEKIDMLKEANSEAAKNVKEDYKKKLKSKFQKK